MTREIFYKKRGRKYIPVSEYDHDLLSSVPEGTHLVICRPGLRSTRYNIDANYAALIAASFVAREKIISSLFDSANKYTPSREPLTPEQIELWEKLNASFGENITLQRSSFAEIADKATEVMQEEANKLMENPAVKKAWEHFQSVCRLTSQKQRE